MNPELSSDDLHAQRRLRGDCAFDLAGVVAAIGPDELEPVEALADAIKQQGGTVPVQDGGGVDHHAQRPAFGIDQSVDLIMTRLADRMGLRVWSEVPVYWMTQWDNPATLANATRQLQEMIPRDRNKASVVLSSITNETPNTPARLEFLKRLIATTHTDDPTRPVTAALLVTTLPESPEGIRTKVIDDPLGEYLDVLGCNEYIGWYEGTPDWASRTRWQSKYNKPLILSRESFHLI
jgi:Glycosyl hydrolases family 2, TIM barrel domain